MTKIKVEVDGKHLELTMKAIAALEKQRRLARLAAEGIETQETRAEAARIEGERQYKEYVEKHGDIPYGITRS